jgi:hypothetical protein
LFHDGEVRLELRGGRRGADLAVIGFLILRQLLKTEKKRRRKKKRKKRKKKEGKKTERRRVVGAWGPQASPHHNLSLFLEVGHLRQHGQHMWSPEIVQVKQWTSSWSIRLWHATHSQPAGARPSTKLCAISPQLRMCEKVFL